MRMPIGTFTALLLCLLGSVASTNSHAQTLDLEGSRCGGTARPGERVEIVGRAEGVRGGVLTGANVLLELGDLSAFADLRDTDPKRARSGLLRVPGLPEVAGVVADVPKGRFVSFAATTSAAGTPMSGRFELFRLKLTLAPGASGTVRVAPSGAFAPGNQLTYQGGKTESLGPGRACVINIGAASAPPPPGASTPTPAEPDAPPASRSNQGSFCVPPAR